MLPAAPIKQGTSNKNSGAGEGNRTLVISLEGFSSTIELHPQGRPTSATATATAQLFHKTANNFYLVEGAGFEPAYSQEGRFTVCCH